MLSYFSTAHTETHAWFIAIHVTLAIAALILGPIAMRLRKGSKNHILVGRVYFWSMVVSLLTAFALLFWRWNTFLFAITIFSLYAAVTGVRSIYRKKAGDGISPNWFDWIFASVTLASGAGLFLWGLSAALGINLIWLPSGGGIPIILIILPLVFGLMISNDAMTDLRQFRNPTDDKLWWWYYHLERMCGSYIALVTAFMVQQVGPRLPGSVAWIVWVTPAIVGGIFIGRWIRSYRAQFSGNQERHSVTTVQPV